MRKLATFLAIALLAAGPLAAQDRGWMPQVPRGIQPETTQRPRINKI